MVEGIGLSQVLQDDTHHLQDVIGRAWVLGDPRDERHSKIHYDLGCPTLGLAVPRPR
jgi:hypothetical protein